MFDQLFLLWLCLGLSGGTTFLGLGLHDYGWRGVRDEWGFYAIGFMFGFTLILLAPIAIWSVECRTKGR